MRVKIDVTAKDIKKGRPTMYNSQACPIAYAIKRLVRRKYTPCIGSVTYTIMELEDFDTPELPTKVQNWITAAFNVRQIVKPFSFFLNLPKEILKPSVVRAAGKLMGSNSKLADLEVAPGKNRNK